MVPCRPLQLNQNSNQQLCGHTVVRQEARAADTPASPFLKAHVAACLEADKLPWAERGGSVARSPGTGQSPKSHQRSLTGQRSAVLLGQEWLLVYHVAWLCLERGGFLLPLHLFLQLRGKGQDKTHTHQEICGVGKRPLLKQAAGFRVGL